MTRACAWNHNGFPFHSLNHSGESVTKGYPVLGNRSVFHPSCSVGNTPSRHCPLHDAGGKNIEAKPITQLTPRSIRREGDSTRVETKAEKGAVKFSRDSKSMEETPTAVGRVCRVTPDLSYDCIRGREKRRAEPKTMAWAFFSRYLGNSIVKNTSRIYY